MYCKCITDGSYGDTGDTHGGVVFYKDKTIASALHVVSKLTEMVSMRNVGGELIAAWCAITAVANTAKDCKEECILDLVYDYKGVGCWATGEWKTNKSGTIWYAKAIKEILRTTPNLKINFIWVKGHQSVEGNNIADMVADYNLDYCRKHNYPISCVDDLIMK